LLGNFIPIKKKFEILNLSLEPKLVVEIETTPEMVSNVYKKSEENINKFKKILDRPLTLAEKILAGHLVEIEEKNLDEGKNYVFLRPDRVALQDVTHIKKVNDELRTIKSIYDAGNEQDLVKMAREFHVSYDLVKETAKIGRLPVVNFAAGGIATPADAAYLMSLGCDGIFVGSGIFKADDAKERARAVVLATTFWDEPDKVKEAQKMIDERQSMLGLDVDKLELRMQERGSTVWVN